MMETIDKLDRIGWIVYVGSVAGMLFMVISALLEGPWKRMDIVKTGSIITFGMVLIFTLIKQWWDPDRYNWQSSCVLIRYCRQYFNIWWDPERFDWKPRSTRFLMNYCKEHFDTWWDPKSFPWETNVIYLLKDFNDKFETWWDEEKFPWSTKFLFGNTIAEEILIRYCVAYFPIWYYADYFQLTDRLCELLKMHCGDFKEIWEQDYLLYKLAKGTLLSKAEGGSFYNEEQKMDEDGIIKRIISGMLRDPNCLPMRLALLNYDIHFLNLDEDITVFRGTDNRFSLYGNPCYQKSVTGGSILGCNLML